MSSSAQQPVNNFETNARRSRAVAETRTSRGRPQARPATGRYDGQKTMLLPTGVGKMAFEPKAKASRAFNKAMEDRPNPDLHSVPDVAPACVVVNVVDPMGNGLGRIQATVNRRVDILEKERSNNRLSEAAYLTGRILQEKFERASGIGGSNWMGASKQDPMVQHELRVLAAVISAEDITKTMTRIRSRLGYMDARLIQRVIGDRMSFGQCAEVTGKNGERGAGYIGTRFREALEDLAESWTARGAIQPMPDDKHAAAAETMVDRQRASMVKGVSTGRRSDELREAARRAEMARKANPARRG